MPWGGVFRTYDSAFALPLSVLAIHPYLDLTTKASSRCSLAVSAHADVMDS